MRAIAVLDGLELAAALGLPGGITVEAVRCSDAFETGEGLVIEIAIRGASPEIWKVVGLRPHYKGELSKRYSYDELRRKGVLRK
jgi:hypothetical protein